MKKTDNELVEQIINETDKQEQGFLIQRYFDQNRNMFLLMDNISKKYNSNVNLSIDNDNEVNLEWCQNSSSFNNLIILRK